MQNVLRWSLFSVSFFIYFLIQDHGENWCGGDCVWEDSKCLSVRDWARDWALSGGDYIKDETTNLMMAAPMEDTCKDNDGFVCKVRLSGASCNVDNSQ